jgi:hypothetical protein
MPLARIFTRNPEGTADLSTQLQKQGYSVEVASPDQSNLAPADLEIEFEVCERADVLDRAADLANDLGADVAVAPGVLQPAAQPMAGHAMAEPVRENVVELKAHADVEHDPEREFEAAFAPVIEMPAAMQATPEVVDVPVMEVEPMPPVAFLEDPAPERYPVASAAVSQPIRPADPMPYLAQLTPFGSPARPVDETARVSTRAQEAKEPSQIQVRSKKVLQDGAKIAAQTWAGALALASSSAASVRNHFEEYKKRAQVRSAEAQAQHAALLLDLEQRRAEAHQRAAELEVAREAAAARLMELVRQRDPGLPPERLHVPAPVEQNAFVQQPSLSMQERMQARKEKEDDVVPAARESYAKPAAAKVTPIELWRRINPQWRAVLSGAAAVTALFIMGIALGIFHSKPPLASPGNQASNGVTVQTGESGGVTLRSGAAQPQSKPQPGQAAVPAQTEARTSIPAKPSPRVNQLVAQESENQIGDDVVIRHFSRPVPTQKPKQAGQQAGLKHFSDLDN